MKRRNRLRRTAEFEAVRAARSGSAEALLRVQLRPNGNRPRVGFSVSRRVGGAVQRNLVRRRLRAAVAARLGRLSPVDLVIIPSPAAARAPYRELAAALDRTLARAGAL